MSEAPEVIAWVFSVRMSYRLTPAATSPWSMIHGSRRRLFPCLITIARMINEAPAIAVTLPSHPSKPLAVWLFGPKITFAHGRNEPSTASAPPTRINQTAMSRLPAPVRCSDMDMAPSPRWPLSGG